MLRGNKEDFNFRELTCGTVMILNDRNLAVVKKAFPHKEGDNAIFACGYIDHTAGITFEVLCVGNYDEKAMEFRAGNPTTSMKLRYDSIDGEILPLKDNFMPQLQDKVDMVRNGYKVNDAILKGRNSGVFDDFRHPQFPDDVILLFYKEGLQPEMIWCRIEAEKEGRPAAILLNEPNADFGLHRGDMVAFDWSKRDDNRMIGVALLPWMGI